MSSDPATGARWVRVAAFPRDDEARLLAGRLEAEGIEARVYPEFQGGHYESMHLPVQVLVLEHRLLEAHRVVERLANA